MENIWFNLMKLLKNILISMEIVYHFKNQKEILIKLLRKYLLNLGI